MHQAIDRGGGRYRILEDPIPLAEDDVSRDDPPSGVPCPRRPYRADDAASTKTRCPGSACMRSPGLTQEPPSMRNDTGIVYANWAPFHPGECLASSVAMAISKASVCSPRSKAATSGAPDTCSATSWRGATFATSRSRLVNLGLRLLTAPGSLSMRRRLPCSFPEPSPGASPCWPLL